MTPSRLHLSIHLSAMQECIKLGKQFLPLAMQSGRSRVELDEIWMNAQVSLPFIFPPTEPAPEWTGRCPEA